MTDCSNADVRDLLPDLLSGRLDAESRAQVESHVANCAACAAELSLLRSMRGAMHLAPSLDVGAIVAAIPASPARAQRRWVGWRVAAAITLLVGGASSLLLVRNGTERYIDSSRTQVAKVPAPVNTAPSVVPESISPAPRPEPQVKAAPQKKERELAMGGSSMGDLSDGELNALLKAIDELDAVPTTDVENAAVTPLAPRRAMP